MKSNHSTRQGFTLIELMVTVVIVAILSAVALASYQGYKRSARRTEGINLLTDVRIKQETFFQTYSRYVSSTTDEDVFDGEVMVAENYGYYAWDNDCTDATDPWCMLGFRPKGVPIAGRNALLFQVQTISWEPGATAPSFIVGDALDTHWWSAQVRGLPTEAGNSCTLIRLSNASREAAVFGEYKNCP